jgi:hypothetical protein
MFTKENQHTLSQKNLLSICHVNLYYPLTSDAHSLISVSIKVKEKTNNAAESRNQSNKEEVMNKWDPEKLQEFLENIETVHPHLSVHLE